MKNLLLILLTFFVLVNCKNTRVIGKTTTIEKHDTTIITVTNKFLDTIIKADTVVKEIYLECDSNNKVVIKKSLPSTQSKRSSINATLSKDGLLLVKGICDSLNIQLNYKDSVIRTLSIEKEKITEVLLEKKGFFDNIHSFLLHIFYILTIMFIGVFLGKTYFKTK